MDPSVLIQPFLHFWYFIPLVVLLAVFRSSWFKGHLGEFIVNASARLFLDKDHYHLIKNVTLPTEDGTTQIDHIIFSRYGVFVVETKSTKVRIFGKPNHQYWIQKTSRHSPKIQSSLHQNNEHMKTLQSLLEILRSKHRCPRALPYVADISATSKLKRKIGCRIPSFISLSKPLS